VAGCEKPRGAASGLRTGDTRMGEPDTGNTVSSRKGRQPGEVKHLSTLRKRKKNRFP